MRKFAANPFGAGAAESSLIRESGGLNAALATQIVFNELVAAQQA